jgi:HPt (histidine-containing phosphotransfer) domain-containing protein
VSRRQADGTKTDKSSAADLTVFDRVHLHQYTGGDQALERELVSLFLGHFAPVRRQLEEAAMAQDWKFAAHSLKGSARSIGAPRIAAIAEELEAIGFNAPGASKAKALAALDEAMASFADKVKKAID